MSMHTNLPKRKSELDAILIQLSSQRPSDVWRGEQQVRQWLREDPENRDVYALLVTAAQKNRTLRDLARNIIVEMLQSGSKAAQQAILDLPSGIDGILADADDAYYAAEYDRAIQLYEQVLRLNPENTRAKDHLEKARKNQASGETLSGLPRNAEQYYRRARSFIAAGDYLAAVNLLQEAIDTAKKRDLDFPEAEEALQQMQNLILANDYLERAKTALKNKHHKEALSYFERAKKLDPTNISIADLIVEERGRIRNGVIVRWAGIIATAFVGFILLGFLLQRPPLIPPQISPSATETSINQPVTTPTSTKIPLTNTVEATITNSVTPAPTETQTSIPTEAIVGVGYINRAIASTWSEPNKGLIERLTLNYPLTLIQRKVEGDFIWYKCRWESNGVTQEGWILSDYITFGGTPTPVR